MSATHKCGCLECLCPARTMDPDKVCGACLKGIHGSFRGKRY